MLNWDVIVRAWPYLMNGLLTTIELTAMLLPIAFVAGLLVGVAGSSGSRLLRTATFLYIDFFRSLPPLVLIIFVFYGLPFLGVRLDAIPAFIAAMTLNGSAYFAEIVRAGIKSVPKGQFEAGRSTGMAGWQVMRRIILPQALRNVLPPLLGNGVELVKSTSLASVVAIAELLRSARIAQGITFDPSPLIVAALMYLVILWPCVRLLSRLERGHVSRIA